MPARDIAAAVFVAFIYGVSFVAIRAAVTDLPPLLVTGYRFFFAAVPLIFLVKRPAVPFLPLAAYGFMQGTVMFGLAFTAIAMGMPAGLTSLVVQLQVFFTMALAVLIFGETPSRAQIIGTVIGFAGIAFLATGNSDIPTLPFLMVVASAFAWAVANIIAKRAKPKPGETLGYVVWSSLFGALPLFAVSSAIEGTALALPPHMPSAATIASIIFLAVITQIIAFTLWVGLLNRHPAPRVMPFALLIPIFGIGSTSLVFGEVLTWQTGIASAIVLCGLAIAIFGTRRTKTKTGPGH